MEEKEQGEPRKRWFDDECKQILEKRRKQPFQRLRNETHDAENIYRKQRNEYRKILREKKRKYQENILNEIEEAYKNNLIRNLYRGVTKSKEDAKQRQHTARIKEVNY